MKEVRPRDHSPTRAIENKASCKPTPLAAIKDDASAAVQAAIANLTGLRKPHLVAD